MPDYFQSQYSKIKGTAPLEIERKAKAHYEIFAKHAGRRQAFIRSAYFKKEKVFLKTFWDHIYAKSRKDRERRLRFYICALDLIANTRKTPVEKAVGSDTLFRFYGKAKDGCMFIVQIKRDKNNKKFHMSVFPPHHQDD
ncbi:MAG: hypothetical protein LBM12_00355 [Candidatus Nomurabacteria bacterium]|jgi:hypothetical protein|nr:hypothetical protein [Candidatus Nomurabacteria bacterium]